MASAENNEQTQLTEQKPVQLNQSERFTAMVMKEFGTGVGAPSLTDYQKNADSGLLPRKLTGR